MLIKCYNKTQNKALRDGNLKGLLITTNYKELAMTVSNNTRDIERGQSRKLKLFYGKGVNSKREHKTKISGKHTPAYRAWRSMMQRCYCQKYHKDKPSYIECEVDSSFLDFQDFADWFYEHPYSEKGYQLDKDLLVANNKIYSPNTCCFIPMEINVMFTDHAADRGLYPQGVSFHKNIGKHYATISMNGKPTHLGYFDNSDEAYQSYKTTKEAYVKKKALEWKGRIADDVFQALINWTLDS